MGKVALVTGASRGVGKGIALGLGEQAATVYVTGRTEIGGATPTPLPGAVQETAEEVTALGGRGIAIGCDHRDDEQTRQAVRQVVTDAGRLDVLVNNVWGGYEYFWDGTPFWEEAGFWTRAAEYIDLTDSESPQFVGRAVAALAADPKVIRLTGHVLRSAHLARQYNFTDPEVR